MGHTRVIQFALLGYMLVVLAILTLSPLRFAVPQEWVISWLGDLPDTPKNFILFVPLGYFFGLIVSARGRRAVWIALLFGCFVSLTIEVSQLFLAARLTSFFDVVGNSLGAAAGTALCHRMQLRLDQKLPSMLILNLPLMNVLYLLLPLMWLAGTGVSTNEVRVWLLLPLGIVGVFIFTGIWHFQHQVARQIPRALATKIVLAWFMVGATVSLTVNMVSVLQLLAVVFLLTVILLFVRGPYDGEERRYEGRVLAMVWPAYLVYLLMLTMGLPLQLSPMFDITWGYPEFGFDRLYTLRVVEQLAALTLLGYLISETFGRSIGTAQMVLLRNLAMSALCAVTLEVVRGFSPLEQASVMRGALGIGSAWFGVVLYGAQVSVVQLISRGALQRAAVTNDITS
ncbi:MAG: VanZ family protein [Gammaproteobacteria bacterium]|jgi:VanZ family protein